MLHRMLRMPLLVAGLVSGATGCQPEDATEAMPLTTRSASLEEGTWTATGSMSMSRMYHAAAMLYSGEVLVSGGYSGAPLGYPIGPVASAEIYSPSTGTWRAAPSMSQDRQDHTATRLYSGEVLITGGKGNGGIRASVELYNPYQGVWHTGAPMAHARYGHTATMLYTGEVLVVGSMGGDAASATAELYDPNTGTWSPAGTLSEARSGHTATLLETGKVLVTGGSSPTGWLTSAEVFDPATGSWTRVADMPTTHSDHDATLLRSGNVLVSGNGTSTEYNPYTNTWSTPATMLSSRRKSSATRLSSGNVLVAGGAGIHPISHKSTIFNSAEQYDPSTQTWSSAGLMNSGRADHTATMLDTGSLLLTGGGDGATFNSRDADLYAP